MTLNYRQIEPEEQDFLFELYCSTRTEELAAWGWTVQQQQNFLALQFKAQQQSYRLSFPKDNYQIILLHQQRVGAFFVVRTDTEIRLIDISLLPSYRLQGIGTWLMGNLCTEAKHQKKTITLQVIKFNGSTVLNVLKIVSKAYWAGISLSF